MKSRLVCRFKSATVLLAILAACGGGWSVDLPNRYRLVCANAYEIAIADPESTIVIPPHIVEYAVLGDVVTGRVEVPQAFEGQRAPQRLAPGYFIVNTEAGTSVDGLSKENWLTELRKLGVSGEPDLERPTSFD